MIQLRPYTAVDYPAVTSWWKEHGFPAIPENKLPPFGFIAEDDRVAKAAAWAYMCNGGTGVAMIEWMVTDPNGGLSAARGLKQLLIFMTQELNRLDYDMIMGATMHKGLIKIMAKVGFEITDEEVTHLLKIKTN